MGIQHVCAALQFRWIVDTSNQNNYIMNQQSSDTKRRHLLQARNHHAKQWLAILDFRKCLKRSAGRQEVDYPVYFPNTLFVFVFVSQK